MQLLKSEKNNTENQLMLYNAFGMVRVTNSEVTLSICAMTKDQKPIHEVLLEQFDEPLNLFEPGGFESALFGAFIIDGRPTRIAYHDTVSQPDTPAVGEIPEVRKIIAQAVEKVRKAL